MTLRNLGLTLVLAMLVVMSGCGGGESKPSDEGPVPGTDTVAAGEKGAPGSTESTTAAAQPYSAIEAQSANERKAASAVGKALKTLADGQRASNEQNGIDDYVFTNEEGYKPVFVGHAVTLFTGKLDDGQYGYAQVVVLGDKVTTEGLWGNAAEPTLANGMIDPRYLVIRSPSDPLDFTTAFEPVSTAEKNAVTRAKQWMRSAAPGIGFADAMLTGYVFAYGDPADRPNALVWTTPDATANGMTSTAP